VSKTREEYKRESVADAVDRIRAFTDYDGIDSAKLIEILSRLWDDGADIGYHDG
jgi:hypothetical protein